MMTIPKPVSDTNSSTSSFPRSLKIYSLHLDRVLLPAKAWTTNSSSCGKSNERSL